MTTQIAKLEDIANIDYGTRVVKSKVKGDEYPVYGGGGETFRINKYNRENCVVVSRFAMSPKCTRYVNEKIFLNDSGLTVSTKDNSLLLQEYLDWYLLSKNDEIYSLGRGAGQRNLEIPSFKRMLISYPTDLEEQRKIISQLKLADEIRVKKKLANDKLDEFLKSTFIFMFGDPKTNSKQLQVSKIKDLCVVQTGSTPKRDVESYYKDATIPWVKTGEVVNQYICSAEEYISEKAIKETNCKLFPVNTILVAMYGQGLTRGRVGMLKIEASTNQACSAIIPSEKINQEFLYNQLKIQYQTLRDYGRGGNQPNLNMDIIRNFEVILPPIEDQNKFAQIVEHVEVQKQKNELVIEQMNKLFNSLSQRSFKCDGVA